MTTADVTVTFEKTASGLTRVSVKVSSRVIHLDEININLEADRARFLDAVIEKAAALAPQRGDIEAKLLEYAAKEHQSGGTSDRQTPSEDPSFVPNTEPLRLAEHFLAHRCRDGQGRLVLRRYAGSFWHWGGCCYRELTDEEAAVPIYQHVDQLETPVYDKDGNEIDKARVVATSKRVREVALALPSCGPLLQGSPPFWIAPTTTALDTRELMICRNGIVNLRTGELLPATPDLFATVALPFDYDPAAPKPECWLDFLDDIWGDDPGAIACLQEWFGYLVSADTRMQKILLIVGPRRSGKGTLGRILTALLGQVSVASPTLAGLGGEFGLQDLIGKSAAVISDARLTGHVDQLIIVERFLAISGEDMITVNRKYKAPVSLRLPVRFVILTNELPRLTDVSGALAGRFVVLQTQRSFFGKEDVGLIDRLLPELPGILVWALEGRRRLMDRGAFLPPPSSVELVRELEDLGSPVASFVRDCCVVGPGKLVTCAVLYNRWLAWCAGNGIDDPEPMSVFVRNLLAAVPGIARTQVTENGQRPRAYRGIALRADGGADARDCTRLHA